MLNLSRFGWAGIFFDAKNAAHYKMWNNKWLAYFFPNIDCDFEIMLLPLYKCVLKGAVGTTELAVKITKTIKKTLKT